jgi:cytochrome b subunit of formate dehydrogenase
VTWKLASSDRGGRRYVWRFSPLERFLHLLVIISFFGLVMTGTPLLFAHMPWARGMIQILGGFQAAGLIHRACAVITFAYFFVHVGHLTIRILKSSDRKSFFWGPDSMVPQPKDVKDLVQTFKWFFGLAPPARHDRWSYMDKLDYWGEFWGVAIIGGSGLVLWFPGLFSILFPGWVFNVATIVHGIEALLAAGVIFTIHFFNVNLRPEKFPIDVVMFTGRATLDYMQEEHPLEYERLIREGRLDQRTAPAPTRTMYVWSVSLGLLGLSIGLALIGLILWALLFGQG